MKRKIQVIEGIGDHFAAKLNKAGISSIGVLLNNGATKAGRTRIAKETGIDEGKILTWVNMADLFRIKGVGEEYSQLLEAAGVDTVKELKNRVPANLHAKMVEVNEKKKLVRQVPYPKSVEKWVEHAKKLEPKVSY